MQLDIARAMALDLMRQHGLSDWRLVFDNAKTRAGVCRPGRREIGLSRVLTTLHTEQEVRDTVLHEIAHALVGVEHGHDAVWRARAVAIGSSGTRCVSTTAARAEAPWTGACPAGHVIFRHRRPQRVQSCRRCAPSFDSRALITWTWKGRKVPMDARYVAELAALTRERLAQNSVDEIVGAAARAGRGPATAAARAPRPSQLPLGTQIRVGGHGRYAGTTGIIEKRGRTRYHVRTATGVLTVPFALAQRLS